MLQGLDGDALRDPQKLEPRNSKHMHLSKIKKSPCATGAGFQTDERVSFPPHSLPQLFLYFKSVVVRGGAASHEA